MSKLVKNFLYFSRCFFSFDKKELKKRLTPQQFYVTQEKGTEPPFHNEYWDNKENGVYLCIVCSNELFTSDHKYESGTGWPSFYEVKDKENIKVEVDSSHGMVREEVLCQCNSHLGHRFHDGPKSKTGLRYCINSASLYFKNL